MKGISNYNKGESLATGFARPKVTSLFFDKIWIPKSLLHDFDKQEYFAIPKTVLINEEKELCIDIDYCCSIISGKYYAHQYCCNMMPPSISKEQFDHILEDSVVAMGYIDKNVSENEYNDIKFKYSKNRNYAILRNSYAFKNNYGININPVFHEQTEFEKAVSLVNIKNSKQSNNKHVLKVKNKFPNNSILSICIEDFPDIAEDNLSWEQVLDIRKDKKRNEQLRKFLSWTERNFQNIPPNQIREILESEMEEYKKALRFFGIKTTTGAFSTIVSSASSIVSILNNPEITLPLLTMTSVSLNYASNTYMSYLENKKKPIAYLYNIENSTY